MNIILAYWYYFNFLRKGVLPYAAPIKIKAISYLQCLLVFHILCLPIGFVAHNIWDLRCENYIYDLLLPITKSTL